MTPDIANSTFVDAPHHKALFHPGEQSFYLCPKEMNQFEVIAKLWVVPISLREHLSSRRAEPTNLIPGGPMGPE